MKYNKNLVERDLQRQCEQVLNLKGYWRMTAKNAETLPTHKVAGWYCHLNQAQRNPFLPDLIIKRGHLTLWCELKIPKSGKGRIKWRPGQREMVEAGEWELATSMDEFSDILSRFEGRKST